MTSIKRRLPLLGAAAAAALACSNGGNAPRSPATDGAVPTPGAGADAAIAPAITARPLPWTVLTIDPAVADVSVRSTIKLRALVGGVPDARASFRVEEGSAGGVVDATGAYTAPERSGTFHVVATLPDSQTATAVVTVKPGGAIAVTPNPARALPDGTLAFKWTVTGLANTAVTWSLLEGASAGSVSSGGEYSTLRPGVFHAVATSAADPSVQAVVEVRVTGDVEDLGGPVIAAPSVRAIWWGTRQDFGDAIDAVGSFLRGVSGSPWLAVVDQYLRGAKAHVTFAGDLFLPGAPSVPHPTPDEVVSAVCNALDLNGIRPETSTVYLLFTPAPPLSGGWAGWHWYGDCHGVPIAASWIARGSYPTTCSAASPQAHAAVSTAAHELVESMTDPIFHYSWINWAHLELADYCPLQCVRIGGVGYTLPSLWSNAKKACAVD